MRQLVDETSILVFKAFFAGIAAGAAVLTRVGIIKIHPHIAQDASGEEMFLTPQTVHDGIVEAGDAVIEAILAMDPANASR